MEWLSENWIWLALGAGFLAYLAFGRGGGCGMSHGGRENRVHAEQAGQGSSSGQAATQQHRHGCC